MSTTSTPSTTPPDTDADAALKDRHRAIWASGDYDAMVRTFLLPLGPRLVDAAGIGPGDRVLDVAAGTGNASLPAAATGAQVTATDLTPELVAIGRRRTEDAGVAVTWREADAEALPGRDGEYDVVMSSFGVMFAPHHQAAADQLHRVCRPGGRIALLSWTPRGMLGALFATMGRFAPPPPPGVQAPVLWGDEDHLRALFGGRVQWQSLTHDVLEITAFEQAQDYGRHFVANYGPTIAVRTHAEREGRAAEFDAALAEFCEQWNRGGDGPARFEKEYLLAVGTTCS